MNEKDERNPNRKRDKEAGISSLIGFDSATSSFLTSLINKSKKKLKKAKLKKSFELRNKKNKNSFYLKSPVLKSFVGQ